MVSRIALISCLVLCCLAVMAAAGPTRQEQLRGRHRSAALKSRPAVATSIATARAQQEESEEPEDDEVARTEQPQEAEEPQHDDEQEEEEEIVTPAPVKPRKPAHRPRAQRPQKRPTTTTAAPESEEEDQDGGVTAVASSVSHGVGAVSHSRAAAYGGRYTNGRFGRRN